MDKHILDQYIDACALIEETEKDIQKLRQKKRTVIQTNVSGSNPEHPYNPQHFKIQGNNLHLPGRFSTPDGRKAPGKEKGRCREDQNQSRGMDEYDSSSDAKDYSVQSF